MTEETLVDRDTIQEALDLTGTCELRENYQYGPTDRTCVAFTCSGWREAMQFFVNLGAVDQTIATNMVDAVRADSMGYDHIYYFPGFSLKEDGDIDDVKDGDMFSPSDGSDPE